MSNHKPGNQKHLTLNDWIYIENELAKGTSFKDIATFHVRIQQLYLRKSEPTGFLIGITGGSFHNSKNFCIHRYHCKKTKACGKILICGIKCTSCPKCFILFTL